VRILRALKIKGWGSVEDGSEKTAKRRKTEESGDEE
jgi:hypothetical protein